MNKPLTADEIIKELNLKPHPEGGWFRETFRDKKGHGDRAHSSAILYLLKAGEGRTLALCGRDRDVPLVRRGAAPARNQERRDASRLSPKGPTG